MSHRLYSRFLALSGAVLIQVATPHDGHASTQAALPEGPSDAIALSPLVTQDLDSPVFLTHAGDGSTRLFVVEQPGRIRIVEQGHLQPIPFLDISERVLAGGERGLLGLAFHPDYRNNGYFYLNYTRRPDGATVVAQYGRGLSRNKASQEERVLLVVPQPYANHNGGMIEFGPDGYLYIALGDGGSGGDPGNRAQNEQELLGKILRINVDRSDPYGVPSDNPFAERGGRGEIYAIGFRNPWRFSFDASTGELWIADVGQDKWEEINLVTRGGNYGWRTKEGNHCFSPAQLCDSADLVAPVLEYGHEKGRCSIIGGYVYRGRALAGFAGQYLYGDYCSGEIFALPNIYTGDTIHNPRVILKTAIRISSFGQDENGELYVLDHGGGLYRITQAHSGDSHRSLVR